MTPPPAMKERVPVGAYMTRGPYAVGPREPLGNARHLMMKYAIRHLPVRTEGKLVGILSDRDVGTVWLLAHAPHDELVVEDAMTPGPYAVGPDEPLADVVRVMADRKIDSTVVVEDDRIVGVFTSTDAMHALVDALEGKLPPIERHPRGSAPRAHGSRMRTRAAR